MEEKQVVVEKTPAINKKQLKPLSIPIGFSKSILNVIRKKISVNTYDKFFKNFIKADGNKKLLLYKETKAGVTLFFNWGEYYFECFFSKNVINKKYKTEDTKLIIPLGVINISGDNKFFAKTPIEKFRQEYLSEAIPVED